MDSASDDEEIFSEDVYYDFKQETIDLLEKEYNRLKKEKQEEDEKKWCVCSYSGPFKNYKGEFHNKESEKKYYEALKECDHIKKQQAQYALLLVNYLYFSIFLKSVIFYFFMIYLFYFCIFYFLFSFVYNNIFFIYRKNNVNLDVVLLILSICV